jgi:hypothetical protein
VLSDNDDEASGEKRDGVVDLTGRVNPNPPPAQNQVPDSRFAEDLGEDNFEDDDENCPPEEEDESDGAEGDDDCDASILEWVAGGDLPEVKIDWECDGEPRNSVQSGASPLHCFERVFPEEALNLIVVETNRHAELLRQRKRKDVKAWVEVTKEEMLKFLGCLMVSDTRTHTHHDAHIRAI